MSERFELNIDSVSFESGESYSILCQYMIIGDEEFTNIYKRFLQLGNDKILIKKIIKKFYEELEPSTKKACIMLDTDGFKEIKSQIDIGRYAFQYKIYINRLGSIPNRVAEFNYSSIIEVVYNAINNN